MNPQQQQQQQQQPSAGLFVGWSNDRTNTIDGNGGSFDSSFPSQSLQSSSSHEQSQSLGQQHSTQNPAAYTPFLLVPRRNGHPLQQQHYHDQQRDGFLSPQEDDSGGDERSASMVLSNPVPDYSVAAGSSPFTLQAQAPHFQPRPRPLSQTYPRQHSGQDLSQDPRQNYNTEWDYQYQQQQQQYQQQHHQHQRQQQQHHHEQQQQRRPPYDQQSYRSGEGSDPRLSDLLPHPTEIAPLLSDHPSASTSGSREELQYQQQHLVPYSNGGPARGSDEEEYGEEMARGGEYAASGRKIRKRRRLKGELPRDYALRKYKCTECEQKFARPSALATHVLTHTKEKPFICGTCDRGFAVMSNLRRHCRVRKHDTTATQTDATAPSPPSELGRHTSHWVES